MQGVHPVTPEQRADLARMLARHLRRNRGADPRNTWVYAAEEAAGFVAWLLSLAPAEQEVSR